MTEVSEGNKLIAEFLGWSIKHIKRHNTVHPSMMVYEFVTRNPEGETVRMAAIHDDVDINKSFTEEWAQLLDERFGRAGKYHKSWDSLMIVVEKIEQEGYEVLISSQEEWVNDEQDRVIHQDVCINRTGEYYNEVNSKSKIQAVWQAVVQFIQWYNQNMEA